MSAAGKVPEKKINSSSLEEALELHRAGNLDGAEALYQSILLVEPENADALHLLALIAGTRGDSGSAVEGIREAIRIDPDVAGYHSNLSKFLLDANRSGEALEAASRAVAIDPGDAIAHTNRGAALLGLRRITEAVDAFDRAIACASPPPAAYEGKASALFFSGNFTGALQAVDEALRLQEDYPLGHATRAVILRGLGRSREAETAARKTLDLWPECANAWNILGNIHKDRAELGAALSDFEKAVELEPDSLMFRINCLFTLHYDLAKNDEDVADAAKRFGRWVELSSDTFESFENDPSPDRTLRIGLVSSDFHRHPVGYFLEGVLRQADHEAVQYVCYSGGTKVDDHTMRLRAGAAKWAQTAGEDDRAVAEQIRRDRVDILVDLSGHTGGSRLRCFAMKPAPVQASWIGSCHTTGLSAIDYIIMDPHYVPAGAEGQFTEEVFRLPEIRWCYTPPEYSPEVAPPPVLERGYPTFGSFNNLAKLNARVVELWARVLKAVPDSRLMLSWPTLGEDAEAARVRDLFRAQGIAADRLLLTAGTRGHRNILGDYRGVDIALDPLPFSGCVTTCEALWMGVPVVTLPGPRPASRQTLGFLHALDRTEWAARDTADYVRIAAGLASDPEKLAEMRRLQRNQVSRSPICDSKRFCRHLEAAFREMWRRWCAARREQ